MSNENRFRRGIGVAIVASAVALTVIAHSAKADPVPGTCKTALEVGIANSPLGAQQMWVQAVVGKFGTKWAHWVGAKNKTIIPVNNGTLYQAVAKPCFYQPVI